MTLLDQAVLAQLAEDIGEEMMPVVIGVFIEEVGEQLAQLPPLYEQAEWRALGRLAHSLKSSCASYGARLSQQQVVALELACQRQDSAESGLLISQLQQSLPQVFNQLNHYCQPSS
ncbi:Hpt domain-containing protein [Aeromonas molluscorum]|jgi:HPt (histidine-containing phosphotransfer) domain-containing protein|uniref:Phosphorelay protein LuxU n=1 Tax=Aeromonas molluscorum 848 TaxID=1268236 RepID=R1F8T6_9GAMM|nr:Hpt domain-containing protein [Aeromonas molluscorum]EOD56168.1 phosphorelay protein LuxU [Aeromonas molluscorum 848]